MSTFDRHYAEHEAYDNIGAIIAGIDPEFDEGASKVVSGPEDIDDLLGAVVSTRNPRQFLQTLARARIGRPMLKAQPKISRTIGRLGKIARQVLVQTGRVEAEYLRRPNTLVSVYTPAMAPGASTAFSIQPGQGNNYYRLLGQIATDEQANIFGYSNITVGGQNHVQFSQSTPTAPVASAVPWAIFQLRENSGYVNLAPWTGQIFDNSTPVTGTIVNMTTGGATDAATVAARIVFLTQTDPCSYRSNLQLDAQRGFFRSARRDMGLYAPLYVGSR